MRLNLPILCIIFLLSASPAWGWRGRVIEVPDGETLGVELFNGRVETVKLYGIETPEEGKPYGEEARRFTALSVYTDIVEVIPVELKKKPSDPMFGMVFMIFRANRFLNEELIRAGYARVDEQSCNLPICNVWIELQEEAREARRGAWDLWDFSSL